MKTKLAAVLVLLAGSFCDAEPPSHDVIIDLAPPHQYCLDQQNVAFRMMNTLDQRVRELGYPHAGGWQAMQVAASLEQWRQEYWYWHVWTNISYSGHDLETRRVWADEVRLWHSGRNTMATGMPWRRPF